MTAIAFILKNWKESLIGLLALLVIILYFRVTHETNRADQAEIGRDAAITISNGWEKMSTVYRNKFGDQVIKTQALEVDKINIEALSKSKDLQWLKKFQGLNKTNSNLQSGSTFSSDFDFSAVPEKQVTIPCPNNSIQAFSFDIHDKWNDIHAFVIDTPRVEIRDKYYGVIELRRIKHWFWKGLIHLGWGNTWEPVSEITNSNKLIKIDSVQVFVIKR